MDNKTRKKVIEAYQTSKNSIQDIARIYKVDVYEVLEVVGEGRLGKVSMHGDLVDQQEAGPNAEMNYGQEVKVPISVD